MFETSFHFKKLFTNSKNVRFSALKMVLFSRSVYKFKKNLPISNFVFLFLEINVFSEKMLTCLKKSGGHHKTSTRRRTWRKKMHELGSDRHSHQPHMTRENTTALRCIGPLLCGDHFDGYINYLSRCFSQKNLFRCNARAYVLMQTKKKRREYHLELLLECS